MLKIKLQQFLSIEHTEHTQIIFHYLCNFIHAKY